MDSPRGETFTEAQKSAIEHPSGPLLVLAGPGSGKTRVITHRIARLVDRGVREEAILAITFTNKAAGEMSSRIRTLIPRARVWVTTFHRFCASLLRRHARSVGLESNYTIYDSSDQKALIRQVLHDQDIDAVHYPPVRILAAVSRAKNDLLSPEKLLEIHESRVGDHFQSVVSRVYSDYQKSLLKNNAVDFDDLLLHVHRMLLENPELRRHLDHRFEHVLVDEYQDTNRVQYELVRSLSLDLPNLCATGDPDQSIYGWRGARIANILQFEQDFPSARTIRLEQNFRSTGLILQAANALICNNVRRKHKDLFTDNESGSEVTLLYFANGQQEAASLTQWITDQVQSGHRRWSDFAIFYRVNSLSRHVEIALSRGRVPYQVAAGLAFYDRLEIKDLLSFLKLVNNPADEIAFRRVINNPPRGIGKTTLQRLEDHARVRGLSLLETAERAASMPGVTRRAASALEKFTSQVRAWRTCATEGIELLLGRIIEETRYLEGWLGNLDEQSQERVANAQELLASARQFDRDFPEQGLDGFLEQCSLINDVDALDDSTGQVTLMTLHAAKGLEFPVVVIVGVEQNLIPHERSLREGDGNEIEEERRLLFVGMTRAREELYLTQTWMRETRGRMLHTIPSDFISEIPLQLQDESGRLSDTQGRSSAAGPVPVAAEDPNPESDADSEPDGRLAPGSRRSRKKRARIESKAELKLMRGSDLLTGSTPQSAPIQLGKGFAIGMEVRHPRYGRGVVRSVGGMSRHRTVTVEFETDGRIETFVAAKCPLQPLGDE